MPPAPFDFCVLGNGPLGAAAALYLAEQGARVQLIGARPEQRPSSHADHSRIYRTRHRDAYWTRLAEANLPLMQALQRRTGVQLFRPAPVYYDSPPEAATPQPTLTPYRARNGLLDCDPCGGVLDPLAYIAALNQAARAQGATLLEGLATATEQVNGVHQVSTAEHGLLRCRTLVDFRGLYAIPAPGGITVARTTLLVRHHPVHTLHGFIRTRLDNPRVGEFFACSHLGQDAGLQTSKFVLADARAIVLTGEQALQRWFADGYRQHPELPWAIEQIRRMGYDILDLRLAPCAFTQTPSGRPEITASERHLRFYGCNGAAAKCAQSLARDILQAYLSENPP